MLVAKADSQAVTEYSCGISPNGLAAVMLENSTALAPTAKWTFPQYLNLRSHSRLSSFCPAMAVLSPLLFDSDI
jgi:hypothetical protein